MNPPIGKNIAKDKTATASTNSGEAKNALNTLTGLGNRWESGKEHQPWLMVDLKKSYLIFSVMWTKGKDHEKTLLRKNRVKIGKKNLNLLINSKLPHKD